MTLVPAAQQLIDEVTDLRPKATAKVVGDADGIGFHRSIAFDAATTKWLAPVLEAIEDPRIESVEEKTVTFVADVRADHATPYNLALVDEVLG